MEASDNVEADPPFDDWERFKQRHADNGLLRHDPLYSLPSELIDKIVEKIPGFFTPANLRFERDLAASAGFCFSRRLRYGRSVADDELGDESPSQRTQRSDGEIKEIQRHELEKAGRREGEISANEREHEQLLDMIQDRKSSYVGWLVTNPTFQSELARLRGKWEATLNDMPRFPRLPVALIVDEVPTVFPEEIIVDFSSFYFRWGLETLVTWDWPVPMEPDWGTGIREWPHFFTSSGLVLIIPWYLLRRGKIDMKVIAGHRRFQGAPDHLAGWILPKSGGRKGKELGDDRFGQMSKLYRWLCLILDRRYETECRRKTAKLDQAIAKYWKCNRESVKKLRESMRKRLRGLSEGEVD